MKNTSASAISVLMTVLLLASCTDNAGEQSDAGLASEAAVPTSSAPDTARVAYAEFNTSATIRDVMNTLIDPSADALWNAVRFEMDENGSRELYPETEEDWEVLRRHAISIIEGGNALMMPGRHVAPAGATTEFPAYEYMPEEVEQKLQQDRLSWIGFAQGLQASALSVVDAINARNVEQLSESGGLVDEACESCHSQYWYRAISL